MSARFYVGLAPWVVFAVADRSGGLGPNWAAVAALVVATAIVVRPSTATARPITLLNIGAIVVFALLALVHPVLGVGLSPTFGRFYATLGLTALSALSLITVPLASHYTEDLVPPSGLASARYRYANRALTTIWATTFAAVAASFYVGALVRSPVSLTVFNWFVPAAVVLWGAGRATVRWERDFDPDDDGGGLGGVSDILRM